MYYIYTSICMYIHYIYIHYLYVHIYLCVSIYIYTNIFINLFIFCLRIDKCWSTPQHTRYIYTCIFMYMYIFSSLSLQTRALSMSDNPTIWLKQYRASKNDTPKISAVKATNCEENTESCTCTPTPLVGYSLQFSPKIYHSQFSLISLSLFLSLVRLVHNVREERLLYMYVHTHNIQSIYTYINACIYVYTYVYKFVYIYIYICIYIFIYICLYVYIYMCVCIRPPLWIM